LFDDDDERFRVSARFFEAGAKAGDKLFYIADAMTPEEVRERLRRLTDAIPRDVGIMLRSDEAYFPEGRFSPDDMLGRIGALLEQARAEELPAHGGDLPIRHASLQWGNVHGRAGRPPLHHRARAVHGESVLHPGRGVLEGPSSALAARGCPH
jgi:hypothetical protein